jgi:hypothetical protein
MSDEDLTTEEERRRLADRSTPVPEADALEQTAELDEDDDDTPSPADDVPEADALEQARGVPHDDDRR